MINLHQEKHLSDFLSASGSFFCDIDKSLISFDGKNWTSNIVKTSADDEIFICERVINDIHFQFQLAVIKNLRTER